MMFRLTLAAGAMFFLVAGASAEWSAAQHASYRKDCIAACEKKLDGKPVSQAKCAAYCNCNTAPLQKLFPNYDTAMQEMEPVNGKEPEKVGRYKAIVAACSKQIYQN
jgi:hypothetical protein